MHTENGKFLQIWLKKLILVGFLRSELKICFSDEILTAISRKNLDFLDYPR